ncbi:hypothetical protein ACRQ5D_10725 [Mucilaginibacter sp. P25]|uniref:hypothetical protein n=1 Tax=Mucilaginibacter sp. P25 TaxID=3423945 RepID=UPI003D796BD1
MTRADFEAGKPFEINELYEFKKVESRLLKSGYSFAQILEIDNEGFEISTFPFKQIRINFSDCTLIEPK